LIEVGSGVHPELTGRENIWLYGQILGLTKSEIRERFDQIVAFAGLEPAIDAPVKFFSSGMQLRLGFSIASHLSPDVFVVDEALAVGDAAFQARCVDRMRSLVNDGHTLIFVSHSLSAVRDLCREAILLDRGRLVSSGNAEQVLETYTDMLHEGSISGSNRPEPIQVKRLQVRGAVDGAPLSTGSPVTLLLEIDSAIDAPGVMIDVGLADRYHTFLATLSTQSSGRRTDLLAGRSSLSCHIPALPFLPGEYEVFFEVQNPRTGAYVAKQSYVGTIVVSDGPSWRRSELAYGSVSGRGPIDVPFEMTLHRADGRDH